MIQLIKTNLDMVSGGECYGILSDGSIVCDKYVAPEICGEFMCDEYPGVVAYSTTKNKNYIPCKLLEVKTDKEKSDKNLIVLVLWMALFGGGLSK